MAQDTNQNTGSEGVYTDASCDGQTETVVSVDNSEDLWKRRFTFLVQAINVVAVLQEQPDFAFTGREDDTSEVGKAYREIERIADEQNL